MGNVIRLQEDRFHARRKIHWRQGKKQRHALLHNCAQGLQGIGERAAAGDTEAFGTLLRLLDSRTR